MCWMADLNEEHTGQLTDLTILIFLAVEELDEYITTQDRTWSAPEHFVGGTNVFDQIISGDYFNEKFDNHINQLDSLQKEVIKRFHKSLLTSLMLICARL